ncbi:tyrosine-type recombinase/integrase [Prevotella fusca]|uniref:Tyrosine-type recombinase/integrase n=1 Tax=Prevotella fusca JCM 17724 TaxID=1236517 RepID=A0A0K1NHR4_9BACT|nr:tyrosine-type recombinase/integrase [Prevotella fusca]AKU68624.1 hypothetical protein ADJ77_01905 [Prevotella fusca JCM 17724]QUB87582.1 tyrosine-type recombinase/integrase [Prevotella fusca JCM 17724]
MCIIEGQLNLGVSFNIRDRKAVRPTSIYCIARIDGKQHKIPLGVKVLASQWDKKFQQAVVSNLQGRLDNYNNQIANNKINEVKDKISEYLDYICTHETETLNFISLSKYLVGMGDSAKDLIESAFHYLYPNNSDTRKTYISRLNSYTDYLKEKSLDSFEVFKQSGINAYTKYLSEKGDSKAQINVKVGLIVRLVNKVLAVEEPYLKYNIGGGVAYNKKKDIRPEKGKFALTVDELKAIELLTFQLADKYDLKPILPRQEDGSINPKYPLSLRGRQLSEYRDIFVLQCKTGLRVSDLSVLLLYLTKQPTDKVRVVEVEGLKFYELKTKKSQGKEAALIQVNDYIVWFAEKYNTAKFLVDIAKIGNNNSYYNHAIKEITRLAGIDRQITYRNAQDKEITEPAYNKISSHCARHTFITQKLNEGISPDKLCYLTGHTDDNMIKTIYTHLTTSDKIKMITKELGKIRGKAVENPPTTAQTKRHETLNVDYDRLLGRIERSKGRLGDVAKWLIDNDISIDALIGYYQKLNPDSINKVGDIVVRADMMMSRLLTIRDIIQES